MNKPLPSHYGDTPLSTIIADFDRLRLAIQRHDPEVTEKAWLECERWVDFLYGNAERPKLAASA